jgi:hypothetical protein
MKKLIALFSGMIIAAGASAQVERAGSTSAQPTKADSAQRQASGSSDNVKRDNRAKEPPESANIVDPDFQGSSKEETTASGMGQPTTAKNGAANGNKTTSEVRDVEDKSKK